MSKYRRCTSSCCSSSSRARGVASATACSSASIISADGSSEYKLFSASGRIMVLKLKFSCSWKTMRIKNEVVLRV